VYRRLHAKLQFSAENTTADSCSSCYFLEPENVSFIDAIVLGVFVTYLLTATVSLSPEHFAVIVSIIGLANAAYRLRTLWNRSAEQAVLRARVFNLL